MSEVNQVVFAEREGVYIRVTRSNPYVIEGEVVFPYPPPAEMEDGVCFERSLVELAYPDVESLWATLMFTN